jgi:23S rRNA (uracil1939-C5)-methyltransferase
MQKGNIGVTTENIFPIIKKFLYSDHEIFLRELVSNAVDATQKLKTLANTEFYVGKAEEVVPALYTQGMHADVVVVDPPRKGCELSVLNTMLAMSPQRIVYVSCEPASLARDLAVLQEGGYQITKVQPVDMFPHSMHVETVVQLTKK